MALVARLKEHRAEFPSLTADFAEEKTTRLLQKPLKTSGTIAFKAPNLFRREVRGDSPSTTVCDGKQLWIYYPNFKEVERYTLGERAFFDDSLAALTAGLNFSNIDDFYRYSAFREDAGYRLVLRPKTGGLKRMVKQLSVWISNDFRIGQTETLSPKDDRIVTTYRNQKSEGVPASTFAFKPPPDAKISKPLGK
ncbi:MAG TPA: outer membrane lipoprotein carrier protein LolA [Chthoniobacteraceae bacterium]|nr:outer membrane lipoprotein carrier protein LolA [Chthoniobacteraceae bacterium]